jgi:hypothetical protein
MRKKMSTYLCGSPYNDEHVEELLRRAIIQGDQEARLRVQLCLGKVVRGWLGRHPNREALCNLDSEENYVAVAFERFWQVTIDKQMAFSTLATALHYLRVSLNGAMLDRLRASSVPKEVPLPQPDSPEEPLMEDAMRVAEVWELLQSMLLNEREQRLAYLLFHCGLGPQEIVHSCQQEFSDVDEIHRLRHTIMERLLCNGPRPLLRLGKDELKSLKQE